ncbi:AIR synthase-related protein [Desulfatirhabdium butyrativorans]|uniref:AIR synthase-related protein n=1 Tax=Desulfatirhabdium butyrativorans TaxID=340467 RepID=UPI0004195D33|nr:AIR synthase-related protein [Desulfatirhabdium butyrativorans]
MAHRLEIALKPGLFDAEGASVRKKAQEYFGIPLRSVRAIRIVTLDCDLTSDQLERVRTDLFTNPVTQVSSLAPLDLPFDGCVWVGFRPGVRDNPGATAMEAMADVLGVHFPKDAGVYTSKRYCIESDTPIERETLDLIARELLANAIIQQWKTFLPQEWSPSEGIGIILPKVRLDHTPTVSVISVDSDETLARLSRERNLALQPEDIPVIRSYFTDPAVLAERKTVGLCDPTDVELEYISQARSDHCNHNTFRGLFRYHDRETGETRIVDNLFKTCIQEPTLALKAQKPWVVSVLWDNAGIGRFDTDHDYVITGETHNSPSNMEAYGGAITGIVGVYRDPLGTGKGSRLIMGSYGFCVGPRDYRGELRPHLHPRRLLDGIIEGVRDGGNKSGIPTPFGQVFFHPGYMGKCLVFVTALGLMPNRVQGKPSAEKTTSPGDVIVMCGGRIGKDGIHGVTASSEVFSEHTPAGHVQIGDPYTQKKMHDFLIEARDLGLIQFVTDNGGGGLSSSIGESARFSNGCHVELEKAPLKYEGLDQWEIWVSESQERMTVAVRPEDLERFLALSRRHAVESTPIGRYTDSGKLHITYAGKTCAHIDLSFLDSGFPQWRFDAEWQSPVQRGLTEPVLGEPRDYNRLLLDLMADPNVCSREWIARQYDHEVQGTSAIKPLVGRFRDVPTDAAVIRPVLASDRGLAFSQALLPLYSRIDAAAMVSCGIDEAVRRLLAVGGDPDHIGGVDNFCWPSIQYDPVRNPDGKFKAAQLVRACLALREMCLAYGIPLLSGKDSMYVDGHLPGAYGETHKVSALETMQFSAVSVVHSMDRCQSMDPKVTGDSVYVIGRTANELGGSLYYHRFGYVGCNVPKVDAAAFWPSYRALSQALDRGLVSAVHGIYSGGLGIHAALMAMAGDLGMELDLSGLPVCEESLRADQALFSESAGRFLVTVSPQRSAEFEALFDGLPVAPIGRVTQEDGPFRVYGADGSLQIDVPVGRLRASWKRPFGELI